MAAVSALAVILIAFATASSLRETKDRIGAAPTRGRFVQAADVDMYLQEWGPPDGLPVVFLHAAGGWSEVWKQTGEALARRSFHSIALDMPPLGYSERPDTPRYSREAQARRVIGVLDALRMPTAVLVGHSFGGRAVTQAALEHPERVRGLVLVDPALSFAEAGARRASLVDAALRIAPLRSALAASTFGNPLFTRKLIQLFVADRDRVTPYWVDLYQRPIEVRGTSRAIEDWLLVGSPECHGLGGNLHPGHAPPWLRGAAVAARRDSVDSVYPLREHSLEPTARRPTGTARQSW